MLSSRLFWKVFLPLVAVNMIAALAAGHFITDWQRAHAEQQVFRQLREVAGMLQEEIRRHFIDGDDDALQRRVERLGKSSDVRLTIIALDGRVLADSDEDPQKMETHKDRVELIEAAAGGEGQSRRVSTTLKTSMFYYALRIDEGDAPLGLLRAGFPAAAVDQEVATLRRRTWMAVFALTAPALIAACLLIQRLVLLPAAALTEAAEAITAGQYDRSVYAPSRDEFSALANAMNRMNEENNARIAQLNESRQRLATLLECMGEAVIAVDDRQRVLFANSAASGMLKFSESPQGRPLMEAVRNHTLHEAVAHALAGKPPRPRETEIGGRHGRIVAVNAVPLPGVPCPGAVLVLHDVTDLRRLESLRQEFVANVSHELKTPLSSIKAYAETLREGAINDPNNNLTFVRRIEEQADRLHQLILDMLSLARIESRQQAFNIVAVSPQQVVDACLADWQAAAEAKRIALDLAGASEDIRVRADEEGLRQILDNLVDNAIKYTPQGGSVFLRWRIENRTAAIEVQDTGIGISVEDQARVFERFFRVDKARSVELGGTGLGLSIVKHLAQSFGGAVRVTSRVKEGSTFTVTLPLA